MVAQVDPGSADGLILTGPLVVAPPATANSPSMGQQRIYYVYYRQDSASPWTLGAVSYSDGDAQWAVTALRNFGYDAFVR